MPAMKESEQWNLWLIQLIAKMKTEIRQLARESENCSDYICGDIDLLLDKIQNDLPSPRSQKSKSVSVFYKDFITQLIDQLTVCMNDIRWHYPELQKSPYFDTLKREFLKEGTLTKAFIRKQEERVQELRLNTRNLDGTFFSACTQYTDTPFFNNRRIALFRLDDMVDSLRSVHEAGALPSAFMEKLSTSSNSAQSSMIGLVIDPPTPVLEKRNRSMTTLPLFSAREGGLDAKSKPRLRRAKTLSDIKRTQSDPAISSPRDLDDSNEGLKKPDKRNSARFSNSVITWSEGESSTSSLPDSGDQSPLRLSPRGKRSPKK